MPPVSYKASYIYPIILMGEKLFFYILLCFFFFTAYPQVPVRFEPRHKVALENEFIRLLDVRIVPGDTSLFHIHQTPSFFIPLSNTAIGSQVKGQLPQESKFTAGATWYNGFENGPLIHRVWDSDTTVLHVIDLELLSAKNTTLPAIELTGVKIDFENEKLRVYKFNIASNQTISLPILTTPMLFISVSGSEVQIESRDKKDLIYSIKAGGFQWLEPDQNFLIDNKKADTVKAILILLK
jgi:hypothetical protein